MDGAVGFMWSHVETISTLKLRGVEQNQNGEFRRCEKQRRRQSRETCGKVLELINTKMLRERQDKILEERIVVLGFLWRRREVERQPWEHTSSKNCIFIGSDGAKKHRLAGEDTSPPTHIHTHTHTWSRAENRPWGLMMSFSSDCEKHR